MNHNTTSIANHGMSRKDLEAAARALGAEVAPKRGTGETRMRHRLMDRHVTMNGRRRDASRAAVAWVRELERRCAATRLTAARRAA